MKRISSKRQLNNKGFSLLELIVTVAIMIALAGAAVVTVSMLDSSYVEDAERGIKDYIALGRTKSMSVSAKDWYVTVGKEGSDYYVYLNKIIQKTVEEGGIEKIVYEDTLVQKQKLGKKINITYGTAEESVSDTKKIELHFDPATGKIANVKYGGETKTITGGIAYIGISRNDYEITLKVFMNTGKCERE